MGFGVWGLGFGVWGLGFGVWGLGWFGVWGLGFRVAAVSAMCTWRPYTPKGCGGGGGAACHAKASVVNVIQQLHWCWVLSPHTVSFHRSPPKPLPFRA